MLTAIGHAVTVGVPVGIGIINGTLETWINRIEPRAITAELPLAPGAQDTAHLAIDAGLGALIAPAPDEFFAEFLEGTEDHVAVGLGLNRELNRAHDALKLREEIRHGVGVTPDVRT